MAINLQKGQRIEIGLQKVGVGLGWDPNESTGYDFDLDASAFMLGENKKLPADKFFVFYNNQKSPDGAVESSGDDLTGGSSDGGDDETLTVDLSKVDSRVTEILFTATIHDAENRRQNFGQVRNSYIRINNAITNEEIAKSPSKLPLSLADFIVAMANGSLRPSEMATKVVWNTLLTNTHTNQ